MKKVVLFFAVAAAFASCDKASNVTPENGNDSTAAEVAEVVDSTVVAAADSVVAAADSVVAAADSVVAEAVAE